MNKKFACFNHRTAAHRVESSYDKRLMHYKHWVWTPGWSDDDDDAPYNIVLSDIPHGCGNHNVNMPTQKTKKRTGRGTGGGGGDRIY